MYDGGTTLEDAANAVMPRRPFRCNNMTEKTLPFIAAHGQETVALNHPIGIKGTDEFLMAISRLSGKPISAELTKNRPSRRRDRRLQPIFTAEVRDLRRSDLCLGLAAFLNGAGPRADACAGTNGGKAWQEKAEQLLASSPFARMPCLWRQDLWHMRSLLFTEPVDFLIGNTYGKYLDRDTGTPLIRIGFPIFDRHHYHRYPVWAIRRTECSRLDPGQDLQRNRRQHQCRGEVRLQLRHHSLMQPSIAGSDFDPAMNYTPC